VVTVLDASGQQLAPCSPEKAHRLLAGGRARLVSQDPMVIELALVAALRSRRVRAESSPPGEGRSLLLHVCCGPCATYSINRLRQMGFAVTGFWYNPNVHPFDEHERRRECISSYAREVGLPMVWPEGYEAQAYFEAVAGHEARAERCAICYRLRLGRTAQVAKQRGFDAFSTTLLISPYQKQTLIRGIGEELATQQGVEFCFENLRRGWGERGRLAREHGLYQQQYCGCTYSEQEATERSRAR